MKIAQIAPLYESVPPQLYGGTERVVSWLTEELVRQGHDVTLFASGDSTTKANLVAPVPKSLRLDAGCVDPLVLHLLLLEEVFRRQGDFDVVHFHCDYLHFPFSRRQRQPHVTTLHGRLDLPELPRLYREYEGEPVVSISDAQRRPLPWLNWQGTVHHGMPRDLHTFRTGSGRYLAFLGRISPEKRVDWAIDVARGTGMPLKVAAKVDHADRDYFKEQIEPLLKQSASFVEFVGEVGGRAKDEFLGGAAALLFPIDWPEPFGLVMIEAMACGTPVIAFRRGSVSEVMDDGATGFVVNDVAEAVRVLGRLGELDRRRCRQVFEERFSVERMTRDYLAVYRGLVEHATEGNGRRHSGAAGAAGSSRPSPRRRPRRSYGVMMNFPNAADNVGDSLRESPAARGASGPPSGPDGKSPFYILASSPSADEHGLVLKHGETFGVFDHYGDIRPTGLGEEGLYHEGTRYLSCLLLALEHARPMFLSSTVRRDNEVLTVDLTNPDVSRGGQVAVSRGTLHLGRTKFLRDGACYERLRLRNYGLAPMSVRLTLHFEADFADLFEVRGSKRARRGELLAEQRSSAGVVLGYRGLDGVTRRTRLLFSPSPAEASGRDAHFEVALAPHAEKSIELTILCERDGAKIRPRSFDAALAETERAPVQGAVQNCTVHCSSGQVNVWTERSAADLRMMTTQTAQGPYPFAGVPWFSCPFGRDGIITALECLWLQPELARGVLAYLAATQATESDPEGDAEPGKILHETRRGEMAALKEVPFGRYYGSIDSTPLFVHLAGAYYARTGDRAFIESIWPNIEAALRWIDEHGDRDGDGFVEYARRSPSGLIQQGWKDSHDSVFHADGTMAQPPIALCEVQGYVYAARRSAAEMADVLGMKNRSETWWRQAGELQDRFERAFWCEDLGCYALALDGDKRPCKVRTSNAGHCLFSGIADRERARRTAETLLSQAMFSGWGVRTLAEGEARYNPMSYHNGSVWPHDNALVAQGLANYGLKDGVLKILRGLFEASTFLDLHRLPELFCGFERRRGEGPTLYPVACSPQAWSAAAPFLLLQACLGLDVRGPERQVCFHQPVLPHFLREVRINHLQVGGVAVDLLLRRHRGGEVSISVPRREGTVEVRVVK